VCVCVCVCVGGCACVCVWKLRSTAMVSAFVLIPFLLPLSDLLRVYYATTLLYQHFKTKIINTDLLSFLWGDMIWRTHPVSFHFSTNSFPVYFAWKPIQWILTVSSKSTPDLCSGNSVTLNHYQRLTHWLNQQAKQFTEIKNMPVPVVPRSKAWVYGRSPSAIVGSNPTGDMDVCRVCLCVVRWRSLRRTDHSSRGVLPNVERCCVWSRSLVNEEAIAYVGLQSQRK
jgi:hypothetical protein